MKLPVPPQKEALLGPGGTLNPAWANFHSQTAQQLRYWFGGDNKYSPVVWDEENKKLMINDNGVFKEITPTT